MTRAKKAAQKPEIRCDFALAIVKGLVEHDNGMEYFGSLGGYSFYEADAIQRGYAVRGSKVCREGDSTFVIETTRLTEAGREVYRTRGLDRLPQKGRAYMWNWNLIADTFPAS